jgi:hypothetical protein
MCVCVCVCVCVCAAKQTIPRVRVRAPTKKCTQAPTHFTRGINHLASVAAQQEGAGRGTTHSARPVGSVGWCVPERPMMWCAVLSPNGDTTTRERTWWRTQPLAGCTHTETDDRCARGRGYQHNGRRRVRQRGLTCWRARGEVHPRVWPVGRRATHAAGCGCSAGGRGHVRRPPPAPGSLPVGRAPAAPGSRERRWRMWWWGKQW